MRNGTVAGQEITRMVDETVSGNRSQRAIGEVIADAFRARRFGRMSVVVTARWTSLPVWRAIAETSTRSESKKRCG